MRHTLQFLGIDEDVFIRECSATFKQGIRFSNWKHDPAERPGYYYHLFDLPARSGPFDLTYGWLARESEEAGVLPFSHAVAAQAAVCDLGLGPKQKVAKPYTALNQYAYHLDSGKFIDFLRAHCVGKLGVRHEIATISSVRHAEDGRIEAVISEDGREFSGDLFIDCSGFSSLLLGESLGVRFLDVGNQLLTNAALAVQLPYSDPESGPILSYTHSQAERAGWVWDIGLQSRSGVGYVYSSDHATDDEAMSVLERYTGVNSDRLNARKIPMRVGYRESFWQKNCVAVGLSAGFVEPLEATAISMIEQSVKMLIERFPSRYEEMEPLSRHFNKVFRQRWEGIIEFIKFHYCISQRTDSDFWLDNRRIETVPEGLRARMERWQSFPMEEIDFNDKFEMFGLASYRYVAYGMGFNLGLPERLRNYAASPGMQTLLNQVRSSAAGVKDELPSHRELIRSVVRRAGTMGG